MEHISCIFGCGIMRNFISPFTWISNEERVEITINAHGRICDYCGAVALIPCEAFRIQITIQLILVELEGSHL